MLKHILPLIPKHSLYTEAFVGGGAVLFAKHPAEAEIINDINTELTNFYWMAQMYYKDLKAEHESVKGKYEEQFGPITAGGGGNADYWDWIATPWPWELAP